MFREGLRLCCAVVRVVHTNYHSKFVFSKALWRASISETHEVHPRFWYRTWSHVSPNAQPWWEALPCQSCSTVNEQTPRTRRDRIYENAASSKAHGVALTDWNKRIAGFFKSAVFSSRKQVECLHRELKKKYRTALATNFAFIQQPILMQHNNTAMWHKRFNAYEDL